MQFRLRLLSIALLLRALSLVQATNFTFSFGNPTQCDDFPVSWTGGTPPFELMLLSAFGTTRTTSIPAESFSNGEGSFQVQLTIAQGKKFLASMSDASGLGSGGTSAVLTVGPSLSNANCNTTDPGADFTYDLDSSLVQCFPYNISNYVGADQPITVWGVVPGGTSFILNPPVGPISFDWIANVAEGTSLLLMMTDSNGRQGGNSDILEVSSSDTTTCLDTQSPASLSNAPSDTATSSLPSTSSSPATNSALPSAGSHSKKSSDTGAIIGGVVAGVAVLAGIVIVVLWRRRRRSGISRHTRPMKSYSDPPTAMEALDFPSGAIQPYPFASPNVPPTNAFSSARDLHALPQHRKGAGDASYQLLSLHDPDNSTGIDEKMVAQHGHHPSITSLGQGSLSGDASSSRQQLAGIPDYTLNLVPRIIMHTDLEETRPEEVIELPPQYSERRAPIAGLIPGSGLEDTLLPPPTSPPRPSSSPLESDQRDSIVQPLQPVEQGPSIPFPIEKATPL